MPVGNCDHLIDSTAVSLFLQLPLHQTFSNVHFIVHEASAHSMCTVGLEFKLFKQTFRVCWLAGEGALGIRELARRDASAAPMYMYNCTTMERWKVKRKRTKEALGTEPQHGAEQ